MATLKAADGCSLYYERTGSGPPVVLIPGLGGDGRFWGGVVTALKDRFDLVVVDHRGAGRSDRPAGRYSIGGIADDMLAIMDQERIAAAHLVGHSTGGAIVQTIALDAPERARSLVISGSWDRSDARFRAAFEARAALLDAGLAEAYQKLTHVFGYDPAYIDAHEAGTRQGCGRGRDCAGAAHGDSSSRPHAARVRPLRRSRADPPTNPRDRRARRRLDPDPSRPPAQRPIAACRLLRVRGRPLPPAHQSGAVRGTGWTIPGHNIRWR